MLFVKKRKAEDGANTISYDPQVNGNIFADIAPIPFQLHLFTVTYKSLDHITFIILNKKSLPLRHLAVTNYIPSLIVLHF